MRASDLDDDRTVYRYGATSKVVHLNRGCCSDIAGSDSYELRAGRVNPDTPVCSHCTSGGTAHIPRNYQNGQELRKAMRDADPDDPPWEKLAELTPSEREDDR